MRGAQLAPDWGRLIDDMLRKKLTVAEIGKAMSVDLTDRMLSHYRAGVQPTYWRGAALIELWCKVTGNHKDKVPMAEIARGHRVQVNRETPAGPQLHDPLPQWPPATLRPPEVAKQRKAAAKRTRKAKEPV